LTGQQRPHLQGAGVGVGGEFDIVDLADGLPGAVDDLPIQQVEVDPQRIGVVDGRAVGVWGRCLWPTPVRIINGIAAIATIRMMIR
jgi:hypothetical protein